MFESPPVDLDVLRRLDSTQVDHTNQGDSFLRVRSDVNAIGNAAADEIEVLRKALRLIQDGWYLTDEPALIEVDTFGNVTDEWSHPAIRRAVDYGSEGARP